MATMQLTARGNKKREAYFSGFPGAISSQSDAVGKLIDELKNDGVKLGSIGACWGYKVLVTAKDVAKLDAIAGIHPS